jgi:hypothetical protein
MTAETTVGPPPSLTSLIALAKFPSYKTNQVRQGARPMSRPVPPELAHGAAPVVDRR